MIVITLFKKQKNRSSSTLSSKRGRNESTVKKHGRRNHLQEIDNRLKKIEEALEKMGGKTPEYHINIEKLGMYNPILKELTFSLDKIDVRDLSGSLNVGNNFGIKTENDKDKEK